MSNEPLTTEFDIAFFNIHHEKLHDITGSVTFETPCTCTNIRTVINLRKPIESKTNFEEKLTIGNFLSLDKNKILIKRI